MQSVTNSTSLTEFQAYLRHYKQECELRIMFKASEALIKSLKQDNFPAPKGAYLSNQKDETVSTVSTADSSGASANPPQEVDYSTLVSKTLESGHKKFKTVIKALELFEAKCVEAKAVNKAQLAVFKELSAKNLQKVVQEYEVFTHQHADSVILAFIFIIVDEIGISKRKFLKIVDLVCRKKCSKLSTIKKSKCYGFMKRMFKE